MTLNSSAFGMPCAAYLSSKSALYHQIEIALGKPEIGFFPYARHTSAVQHLENLVAPLIPVRASDRQTMVLSVFGPLVMADLDCSGSNRVFTAELLRLLNTQGLLIARSASGSFLLLDALVSLERSHDVSTEVTDALRWEVTSLINILGDQYELDYSSPEFSRLKTILIGRVPADADDRSTMVAETFGSEFASQIDFQGSTGGFVFSLLQELSFRGLLNARDHENKLRLLSLIKHEAS